jgi:hypothetical protein
MPHHCMQEKVREGNAIKRTGEVNWIKTILLLWTRALSISKIFERLVAISQFPGNVLLESAKGLQLR